MHPKFVRGDRFPNYIPTILVVNYFYSKRAVRNDKIGRKSFLDLHTCRLKTVGNYFAKYIDDGVVNAF